MKIRYLAVGLASIACLLVAPSPAWADPGDDWLPGIRDSASLDTPVVAGGNLRSPRGTACPVGTRVVLRAGASTEVRSALRPGESVVGTPDGKALVGPEGGFELRIEDPTALSTFADESNLVTFGITSATTDSFSSYDFSRRLVANASGWTLVDPVATTLSGQPVTASAARRSSTTTTPCG